MKRAAHGVAALTLVAVIGSAAGAMAQNPGPVPPPAVDAGAPAAQADAGAAPALPSADAGAAVSPPAAAADAGAGPSADAGPIIIQPPPHAASTVTAAPSSPEVVVGKRFSLFITVDPGRKAKLDPGMNFGGAFDVGRQTHNDRKAPGGQTLREFEVEMVAWVVGDLQIPRIRINYAHDGTAYSVYTDPVRIKVISFIGDGAETLRDVAPPVDIQRRDWLVLYLLAGVLGACVLGVVGVFATRRVRKRSKKPRRQVHQPLKAPALLRPDQEALARLEALEHSGALDETDRKPAYIELSEIMRNYLARRYGFPALDLTTGEIKQRMKMHPDTQPFVDSLGSWLEDGDMVRYANYKPERDEAFAAIAQARDLVAQSWQPPRPQPVAVAPVGGPPAAGPQGVVPQPPVPESVAPALTGPRAQSPVMAPQGMEPVAAVSGHSAPTLMDAATLSTTTASTSMSGSELTDTLRDTKPDDQSEEWGRQPDAGDTLRGIAASPPVTLATTPDAAADAAKERGDA